jgi:hypothetical protein
VRTLAPCACLSVVCVCVCVCVCVRVYVMSGMCVNVLHVCVLVCAVTIYIYVCGYMSVTYQIKHRCLNIGLEYR